MPTSQSTRCSVLIITALIISCALAGFGCNKAAPAAGEAPMPKVTTTTVLEQEIVDSDDYTGQTEASETVEVRARVFGYLKTINFRDGDFVKGPVLGPNGEVQEEGQVLFTIEPDEYDAIHRQSLARIDLHQANLTLAQAKVARNAALLKKDAVSKEEYEESVAAMQTAQASITSARADANRTAIDLKYTVVRAPISGRIDRAFVSQGNLLTGGLTNGTLLTKIVNEQPMYVYFDVDERSLLRYMRQRAETRASAPGSLRDLGIPCYLQLADEKEFSHPGTLDFIATTVNRTTGTARLRGVFPNTNRELASGLFVRLRIPVSKPYQALLIPEQALATDQNIKFVYVVGAGGTAERRSVELGSQRSNLRIITSGLKAGDQVIVKGLQRVKSGQKVEAELVATPPPPAEPKPLPATAPASVPNPAVPNPGVPNPAAPNRTSAPPAPAGVTPNPTGAPAAPATVNPNPTGAATQPLQPRNP